ncbi:MAG: DUF4184 family protein [Actinobacteria bacterium]|nr:DUF4184 family protein [Actinomycetota bacterium]
MRRDNAGLLGNDAPVPVTFLAHQAPALAIKRRWPRRFDGVGLVVGTVMPDVWYVTVGWLYGPFGIPLWVDGHQVSAFGNTTLVPGFVLTLLIRWAVFAERGPRWWVTLWSVALGGLTHLALDPLSSWHVGVAPVGQAALSVPLVVASIVMLRRWWPGLADRVVPLSPVGVTVATLGAVASALWSLTRLSDGWMTGLFSAVDGAAVALLLGWVITRLSGRGGRRVARGA